MAKSFDELFEEMLEENITSAGMFENPVGSVTHDVFSGDLYNKGDSRLAKPIGYHIYRRAFIANMLGKNKKSKKKQKKKK